MFISKLFIARANEIDRTVKLRGKSNCMRACNNEEISCPSFAENSVSDDIERSEKFYRINVYAFILFKRTKQLDVVEIPIRL